MGVALENQHFPVLLQRELWGLLLSRLCSSLLSCTLEKLDACVLQPAISFHSRVLPNKVIQPLSSSLSTAHGSSGNGRRQSFQKQHVTCVVELASLLHGLAPDSVLREWGASTAAVLQCQTHCDQEGPARRSRTPGCRQGRDRFKMPVSDYTNVVCPMSGNASLSTQAPAEGGHWFFSNIILTTYCDR